MPWQCFLIGGMEDRRRYCEQHGYRLPVGAMYYGDPSLVDPSDAYGRFALKTLLSNEYKRDWLGKRLPLFVVVPGGGEEFCPDFTYSYARGKGGQGWTVAGEPPVIRVSPSINCETHYHGFLIAGQLSDDVEGRRYGG